VVCSRKQRPSGYPLRFYHRRLRHATGYCRAPFACFRALDVQEDSGAGLVRLPRECQFQGHLRSNFCWETHGYDPFTTSHHQYCAIRTGFCSDLFRSNALLSRFNSVAMRDSKGAAVPVAGSTQFAHPQSLYLDPYPRLSFRPQLHDSEWLLATSRTVKLKVPPKFSLTRLSSPP